MNKVRKKHSTVVEDHGVNYREIADTMTILGFPMNHSSARNHVIRIMLKFALAMCAIKDEQKSESELLDISRNPDFQSGIAEMLHMIEADVRKNRERIIIDHGNAQSTCTTKIDTAPSPQETENIS